MQPTRHASVAARAAFHYGELCRSLGGIVSALREVEADLAGLARQYRALIGSCRLALYIKRSAAGRPRALHWACLFRRQTDEGARWWRHHIKGRLTKGVIYRVARRLSEHETFFRYDERRLALNDRHAALAGSCDRVRKSVKGLKIPGARLLNTPPPAGPASLQDEPSLINAAWLTAWACAHVADEMLCSIAKARRSLPPAALFPYAALNRGYVTVGWAEQYPVVRDGRVRTGRRHVANRLTTELLKRYRVPKSCWPPLRAFDRLMEVLRREQGRYSRAIGIAKHAAALAAAGHPARAMVVNGSAQTPISSLPSPTIP